MVSIYLSVSGLDSMIDSFQRIQKPGVLVKKELGLLLDGVLFKETQSNVHVISGRLKASGRTVKDMDHHEWTGEIRYGGRDYPVPGYSTSAYYAGYENAREGSKPGHGPHDFFTGLDAFDGDFAEAINSHFDRSMKKVI